MEGGCTLPRPAPWLRYCFQITVLWKLELTMCAEKRDSFVFALAYMGTKEPAPPNLLRDLLVFTENEQMSTIVGTDTNAHQTISILRYKPSTRGSVSLLC